MGLIHTHAGETNIFLGNVGIGAKPNERLTVAGSISANNTIFGKAISSGNYLGTWRGDPLSSDQVVVESIDLKTTNISGGLILQADGKGGIEFVEASSINANNNIEGDLTVTGFISAGGNLSASTINAATSFISGGIDLLDIFGAGGCAGGIGGSGTISFIPKFTATACIGDSIIRDTGTTAVVGGNLSATGNLDIDGDSTILGNLSVHGDMHYIDTNVTVTSALSVVNTGTGPALFVRQDGAEPIAHFIDKDGDDIVFADDGKLGIGTFTPGEKISVVGNISACGVLYSGNNLCINADNPTNAVIGQSRIGNYISDAAYFSHFDYGTSTNYALNQNSSGNTSLNAPTGGNVKVKINNSPKLTVDSAGNVGINTTTPGETFVVDGRTCISGNLSAACITTCKIFDYTLPNSYYLDPSATTRLNVLCLAGYACFSELRASTLTLKGNLSSCGTGVFKSLSAEDSNCCNYFAGNVGIGRANSLSKLHVGPNSLVAGYTPDRTTLAVSDITDGAQLILRGQSPRIWFDTTSGGMAEMYLDCQQLNILQGTPSSAGSSRFYIKAGGDVGIGTTTPAEKLTVAGNISASGCLYLGPYQGNCVSITNQCLLRSQSCYGYAEIGAANGAFAHIQTDRSRFYLNKCIIVDSGVVRSYDEDLVLAGNYTGDACDVIIKTNDIDRVHVQAGGNVGIATTTPGDKLSVYGNISASCSICTAATTNGFMSAGRDLADIFQVEPGGVDGSGTACFLSKWTDSDTIGNSIICANSTTATVQGNAIVEGDFCSCALSSTNSSCDNYFAGNVGFGITTPDQKLHVCGTGILDSLSANDSSCNNYFAGNVGIGIGIPSAPLHVACLNGISTLVIHRDGNDPSTSTALNRISFKTDFSSAECDVGKIDICTNSSSYRTDMDFFVKSTGGNICKGLTIHGTTNDGARVGIGNNVSDPTEALTVMGNITGSGDICTCCGQVYGHQVRAKSCLIATKLDSQFCSNVAEMCITSGRDGCVRIGTSCAFAMTLSANSAGTPRVGIGTSTPDKTLVVRGTDAEVVIDDIDSTDTPRLRFRESGNTSGQVSTDSCNLRFFTQSSERMRLVNSTGNVGIGTTSPDNLLDIEGCNDSTSDTQGVKITNTSLTTNSNAGILFKNYDNNGAYIRSIRTGSSNGKLSFGTNSGSGIAESNISERMVIDHSGCVGIGTTTPSDKLTVAGAISAQNSICAGGFIFGTCGRFSSNICIGGNCILFPDDAASAYIKSADTLYLESDYDNDDTGGKPIIFQTAASEKMRINGDGNVGIGTAAPGAPFHIKSTTSNTKMRLTNDNSTNWDFTVGNSGYYQGNLFISNPSISNEQFTLGSTGNVGINIFNPGQRLTVGGNISATGSICTAATTNGFMSAGRDLADIFETCSSSVDGSGTACFLSKWTDSDTIGNSIICADSTTATVCGNATIQGDLCSCALSSTNSSCDNYFAGNVGIGTTSPATKLVIDNGGVGTVDSAYSLAILGDGIDGVQIISCSSHQGRIVFGDNSSNAIGRLNYDHSNDSMSFVTNASEAMRINSSGNVGIGITSPSRKLHVKGNVRAEASGSTAFADLKSSQIYASSTYDLIVGTNNPLYFRTNDTRRMTILGDGNVGIGTTSPSSLLHLSASDPILKITDTSGSDNGATLWLQESDSFGVKLKYDSNSDAFFKISTIDGGTEADRFAIKRTGEVGIGTTSPGEKLTVAGNISTSGGLSATGGKNYFSCYVGIGAGNNHPDYELDVDGNVKISSERYYYLGGTGAGIGSDASSNIKIKQNGSDLVFGSGDNIGIGTSAPAEKLTVSGNISACGSICTAATTNGFMSAGRDLADIFETCSSSVDGSGTAGKLPVWIDSDTLGDSPLSSISGGISIDNDNSNGLNITTSCTVDKIRSDASFLVLEGDNVILRNCGGTEDYGKFQENGAVLLYHNNVQKFETTSAGITINGSISSKGYCSDVNNNTFLGTNALDNSQSQTCNTAIGCGALECNTTGNTNVAVGACAIGFGNDGCYNVAVGEGALCKVTANDNVAVGRSAMRNNTSGIGNTAVGRVALLSNTTACGNVGVGCAAGCATTTGFCNTSVGTEALRCNTTGCNNTAIGRAALRSQTTASNNVAVGHTAGVCNTTGCCNTGVGVAAMALNTTGIKNIALGYQSLYYNLTSSNNVAIGSQASWSNTTGSQNIAIGTESLCTNTEGSCNVAIGYLALKKNTTGCRNTAIGRIALCSNTSGHHNIAVGDRAMLANTTGCCNIGIGVLATRCQTTGSFNIGIGICSLFANLTGNNNTGVGAFTMKCLTTGCQNTAMGRNSLCATTEGTQNTAIGANSLTCNTTGSYNTALGYSAGFFNSTGNYNTGVGYQANQDVTTSTYNTAVGFYANRNTTTGNCNTALGGYALNTNTTGGNNVAIGMMSLCANTTGSNNIAVGKFALRNNTTAIGNVAVGQSALCANTTATGNTAVGCEALKANTDQINNTAIGLQVLASNTTGSSNTGLGAQALLANTSGYQNTAGGEAALQCNTCGLRNTALGYKASQFNTSGDCNVAVGCGALLSNSTADHNTAVGNSALENATAAQNTGIGSQAGKHITSGLYNTAVGFASLYCNSTGNQNTALGWCALFANTAANNTAVGAKSLCANTTGIRNTSIGDHALAVNTTGNYNVAVGDRTLTFNITAVGNTAVGYLANYCNRTGCYNTGLGYQTLFKNTEGRLNTAVGTNSLVCNTTGCFNTAVGNDSLGCNCTTHYNTAVGYLSLRCSTGSRVVGIGVSAGCRNSGNCNTFVGYEAGRFNCEGVRVTALGYQALGSACNCGCNNTAVGALSLRSNTTGVGNQAFGYQTLECNTTGCINIAVGYLALLNNVSGNYNIGIGSSAGGANCTGHCNTSIGVSAGRANVSGGCNVSIGPLAARCGNGVCQNIAIGTCSLFLNASGSDNLMMGHLAGYATNAHNNIGIGTQALQCNTTGVQNIAIGRCAICAGTTSCYNTAIGGSALCSVTTGSFNIAIGSVALHKLTTGNSSIGIGYGALACGTTSSGNVAIGSNASYCNVTGCNNVAVGGSALNKNTGSHNTGIGANALKCNVGGTCNTALGSNSLDAFISGIRNTAVGFAAGSSMTCASENTMLGAEAMIFTTTGARNTAVGQAALYTNTTGCQNTALGRAALFYNTTGINNAAVGYGALNCNTTGGNNVGIGLCTLACVETGCCNIAIGECAGRGVACVDRTIAIGHCALFTGPGIGGAIAIGAFALKSLTTGPGNMTIGSCSMCTATTACNNTGYGVQAQKWLTTGRYNTSFGHNTLAGNRQGCYNTALGYLAGVGVCGGNIMCNTYVGACAGYSNCDGCSNVAVGCGALFSGVSDDKNVAIGQGSLYTTNGGGDNTAVGFKSLYNNTTGDYNTAVGLCSLVNNTTGIWNTAVGYHSGDEITTGTQNTIVGPYAGQKTASGVQNTYLGFAAGRFNVCGQNVAIGHNAARCQNDGSTALTCAMSGIYIGDSVRGAEGDVNSIVIGNKACSCGSNTVNIGNCNTTCTYINGGMELSCSLTVTQLSATGTGNNYFGGKIGIGTTTPQKSLEIAKASTSGGGVIRLTGTGESSCNDVTGAIEFYNCDTTDNTPGVFGIIRGVAGPSGGEGSLQFLTDMPSEGTDACVVAMHIASNANVGIGTTSPLNRFNVVGSSDLQTAVAKITRTHASASNNTYSFEVDSSAHTSNMTLGGAMAVDVNSGRAFTINGFGRVGIGTSCPLAMLQIGDGSCETVLFHSYDQHNEVKFYGHGDKTGCGVWEFINDGTWDQTRFFIQDANNSASRLTLDVKGNNGSTDILAATSTGNVGINCTAPGTKLHVKGAVKITNDSTSHTGGLCVVDCDNARPWRIYSTGPGGCQIIETSGTSNPIHFGSELNGAINIKTCDTTRMFISGGGHAIGIGSFNPTSTMMFADNCKLAFGNGSDLQIYHAGCHSYVDQTAAPLGDLYIRQMGASRDILIQADTDGDGTASDFIIIDGSQSSIRMKRQTKWDDSICATFGDGSDLCIYHNGTHNFVTAEGGNGSLYIRPGSGNTVQIEDKDGQDMITAAGAGAVNLYYNNSKKLETINGGVCVTGDVCASGNGYFSCVIAGGYFEEKAANPSLAEYPTGTLVIIGENGDLVKSTKQNDIKVFGVTQNGACQPIVLGAEPVLVTGDIKIGDYITTSNKPGHGMKATCILHGAVIAQAMEAGCGDSHLVKAMIRKM